MCEDFQPIIYPLGSGLSVGKLAGFDEELCDLRPPSSGLW